LILGFFLLYCRRFINKKMEAFTMKNLLSKLLSVVFFTAIMLLCYSLSAQCDKFVKTYQSPYEQKILSSVLTSDGHIVMTGYSVDASNKKNLLIMKTDINGNLIITKAIEKVNDMIGYSVIETHDGNYAVAGEIHYQEDKSGLLILKFDTNIDTTLWIRELYLDDQAILDFSLLGNCLIEDRSDNNKLVITGMLKRSPKAEILLAKYSSFGSFLEANTLFNPIYGAWGYSIVKAGNSFIVGGVLKNLQDDEFPLIVKTTESFFSPSAYTIDPVPTVNAKVFSLVPVSSNAVIVSGSVNNFCIACCYNVNTNSVSWIRKYSANTSGHSIFKTSDNNVVITGISAGRVLISKLNASNGNQIFGRSYGSNGYEIGHSVLEDVNQNLHIHGYSNSWSSLAYDPFSIKCNSNGQTCLPSGLVSAPEEWFTGPPNERTLFSLPASQLVDNEVWYDALIDLEFDLHAVCSNCTPTAIIDSIIPNPGLVNETISFYGHGEDLDGEITGFEWSYQYIPESGVVLPPQVFCTYQNCDTSFAEPGNYRIGFRVKDNDENWSEVVNQMLMIVDDCPCNYTGRCNENVHLSWASGPFTTEYTTRIAGGAGKNPDSVITFLMETEVLGIGNSNYRIVTYHPLTCDTISTLLLASLQPGYLGNGLAFDQRDNSYWVSYYKQEAIPTTSKIINFNGNGEIVAEFSVSGNITGIAIDPDNNHLWALAKGAPDMFFEFDINNGNPALLQSFAVPWKYPHDNSAAGLDYLSVDNLQILAAINTFTGAVEYFEDMNPQGADGVKWLYDCLLQSSNEPQYHGIAILNDGFRVFVPSKTANAIFPMDTYNPFTVNIMKEGFSFISSNLESCIPDFDQRMENVLDNLCFARNTDGNQLLKFGGNWINQIGEWNVVEGYLVKMCIPDQLVLFGAPVGPFTEIPLSTGFNIAGYLHSFSMDALMALENILDNMHFCRNSEGKSIIKFGGVWINLIGTFKPGEGYLIKMNEPDTLIYPEPVETVSGFAKVSPQYFKVSGGNPADPVWTIFIDPTGLESGDEIAIFSGETLSGAGVIVSEKTIENSIPVFSNLIKAEQETRIVIWKKNLNKEILPANIIFNDPYSDAHNQFKFPDEDGKYSIIGFETLLGENTARDSQRLTIYPNPTTGLFTIEGVQEKAMVKVFNTFGVSVFESELSLPAQVDLSNRPKGIYFIRMETETDFYFKKIVLN
jgi:hypothetical protein